MSRFARVALALVLLTAGSLAASGVVAAVSRPSVNATDRVVNGIFDGGGTHGIVIVNSYSDGVAKIDLSFDGLSSSVRYRLIGSAAPCTDTNSNRTTIFGIIIVNSRDPFHQVRNTSIHAEVPEIASFRLVERAPRVKELSCVRSEELVPAV